jgi:hypothetical protein
LPGRGWSDRDRCRLLVGPPRLVGRSGSDKDLGPSPRRPRSRLAAVSRNPGTETTRAHLVDARASRAALGRHSRLDEATQRIRQPHLLDVRQRASKLGARDQDRQASRREIATFSRLCEKSFAVQTPPDDRSCAVTRMHPSTAASTPAAAGPRRRRRRGPGPKSNPYLHSTEKLSTVAVTSPLALIVTWKVS